MRSFLVVLSVFGLAGMLAAPVSASACSVMLPCHFQFCRDAQTVLEGSVTDLGEGRIALRIERVHGRDTGAFQLGDEIETYRPFVGEGEIDGGLMYVDGGFPSGIMAIRSGEVLCSRGGDERLPVADAIDMALSEDCVAKAEEALGPIPVPECPDESPFGCTTESGATSLIAIAVAFAFLATSRTRGSPIRIRR